LTADQQEYLLKCAEKFLSALTKYAADDPEVERVREFFLPWYEKIKHREIVPPCDDYTLFIYFTNPDLSHIAEKYTYSQINHELSQASAEFSQAMRGW
jgi:hypothetical protein